MADNSHAATPERCHFSELAVGGAGEDPSRQIEKVLERIDLLTTLCVDPHLADMSDATVRRYATRLAARAPAVSARIADPGRTIEVACFLRYCMLVSTDHLLLMVRRRVADLWRTAVGIDAQLTDWARLYQELLGEIAALAGNSSLSSEAVREVLAGLLAAGTAPSYQAVRRQVRGTRTPNGVPCLELPPPDLSVYDRLLDVNAMAVSP